jgi:DmsE family decaheme c-type cytochrome
MVKCNQQPERRGARPFSVLLLWAGAVILACATVSIPIESRRHHRTAAIEGADQPIGAEECSACHDEVLGHAPITAFHEDCESCHGAGTLHVDSEATTDIRFPTSRDCLACHESGHATHLAWGTGEHERAGLLCSDCHNPHNREPQQLRRGQQVTFLQATQSTQLCISCHPGVASQLNLPSHHPVREGMLDCTDCHEPHGDRRTELGHQDHVGPWIFEHPPVIEDCTMCHAPHGAAAYNLLDTNQPAICLSCHTPADTWHGSGAITGKVASSIYTRCTDCHGAIHGSYEDPHLRW